MSHPIIIPYIFDLELSGRCNTVCTFCPREEMKRGEQYMSDETFENFFRHLKQYAQLIEHEEVTLPYERGRARLGSGEESPLRIIMCGMGESLMHRRCAEWVARIRSEIGIRVTIVTNGLLLKDAILDKLVSARITVILVSVPGVDRESYSRYTKLDWGRILGNIQRAHDKLPGRVQINVTIPDDAEFTADDVTRFWESRGIPIAGISYCHNRGGFLLDSALTGLHGASSNSFCGIIARHNFIAWDGRLLSCCHDLHADNVLGHVSQESFLEIAVRKTPLVADGPTFPICMDCNDCERLNPGQIISLTKEMKENPLRVVH